MGMPLKFGMFIHFGVYALTGYHEQVRWRFFTPRNEYRKLADKFTLDKFDPDEWVRIAKSAGMEYICVTTKHHDGFCMFDTAYTDFKITNTPYGKDFLAELSAACKRGGLKLSLYYSNPDWDCKFAYNSASTHQLTEPDYVEDIERLKEFQKNQIRELLTNYGEIYQFFWDILPRRTDLSMNEFIRSLQPNILINDRGWGDPGDYATPERKIPDSGRFERFTEACQSIGKESWGYCSDEDYFTPRFLISSIDSIRALDGSYLLNIGPMPNGKLPERAVEILGKVGDWYNRVKESFDGEPYTELEHKSLHAIKNGDILYVHIPKGLDACGLTLKPLHIMPKSVTLLNSGESLKFNVVTRPEDKNWQMDLLNRQSLHIFNIPADKYENETMVLKIKLDEGRIEV